MHYRAPLFSVLLVSACSFSQANDDTHTGDAATNDTGAATSGTGAATSGTGAASSATGASGNGATGNTGSGASGNASSGATGNASSGGSDNASGATGNASGGGSGNTGSGASGSAGGSSPTSGCGTSAPNGVQSRTLAVRGETRSFVLSVPADYDSSQTYPLVFAWHGQAGDGALARRYFGVEKAAAGSAIFVYPDGLPRALADGDTAWDLSPDGTDVALFDALLTSLSAEYCVDASRVFSTGHSYGAYMTNRLGCSRASVLRGVAPVAGGPPFGSGRNTPCVGEVAALLVHGENDVDVEFSEGVDARDRYLGANSCAMTNHAVTPAPCVSYDACSEGHPVLWCEHQGDHAWPAFAGAAIAGFFATLD